MNALPEIIDHYSNVGYRFATIADLLGKTRAAVMPRPESEELRFARIEGRTLGA